MNREHEEIGGRRQNFCSIFYQFAVFEFFSVLINAIQKEGINFIFFGISAVLIPCNSWYKCILYRLQVVHYRTGGTNKFTNNLKGITHGGVSFKITDKLSGNL